MWRVALQRMPASEMFMHFLDVHQVPAANADADIAKSLIPIEIGEIVMSEVVNRLIDLCVACHHAVRSNVKVCVFDWGRSELNTLRKHEKLTRGKQQDRLLYWKYYCGGIVRLAWEAARYHWHRFMNESSWGTVLFDVFDFDSCTANDYIGQVKVTTLENVSNVEASLLDPKGKQVYGSDGKPSTLMYSMSWLDLPEDSALRGTWRIVVHSALHLPALDVGGTSDPFVAVIAVSPNGEHVCQQNSSVIPKCNNPSWNECFDLPIRRHKSHFGLDRVLEKFNESRDAHAELSELFPSPVVLVDDATQEKALAYWTDCLDIHSGSASFCRVSSSFCR